MNTDVLIIGGGLSGLALAGQLERSGRDYLLLEARERLGGRILSLAVRDPGVSCVRYDMGPAWFWPGQPKMERLVSELGLNVFEQYSQGTLVFEDHDGVVRRDLRYSTMAGSLRIEGGLEKLIEALAQQIPAPNVRLSTRAIKMERVDDVIRTIAQSTGGEIHIESKTAVIALPPRLAAATVAFAPEPANGALQAMRDIPTWMAGHAKVVAVYERPFWRDVGQSGDGVSHRGPLVEIHDASPASGPQGALFGFVGIPAAVRQGEGFDLAALALQQLVSMFGPQAATPLEVLVRDWAEDGLTATEQDSAQSPQGHPAYGTPPALRELWGGKLVLGSSEMASGFGGYLEGALEAAEMVAERI